MATLYRCNTCGYQTEAMQELALHMIEHCRAGSFKNEDPGKPSPEDDEKEE